MREDDGDLRIQRDAVEARRNLEVLPSFQREHHKKHELHQRHEHCALFPAVHDVPVQPKPPIVVESQKAWKIHMTLLGANFHTHQRGMPPLECNEQLQVEPVQQKVLHATMKQSDVTTPTHQTHPVNAVASKRKQGDQQTQRNHRPLENNSTHPTDDLLTLTPKWAI